MNARPRPKQWAASLVKARERMANAADIVVEGTLNRMVGMTLEAIGCEAAVVPLALQLVRQLGISGPIATEAAVGGRCLIDAAEGKQIEAEVVGFSGDKLFLMPTGDIRGIMPGARVVPTQSVTAVAVGDERGAHRGRLRIPFAPPMAALHHRHRRAGLRPGNQPKRCQLGRARSRQ